MIQELITSKRVWGVVVAGLVMLLSHFHIVIPDAVQPQLVDNGVAVALAVWSIITKVMDAKKAVAG